MVASFKVGCVSLIASLHFTMSLLMPASQSFERSGKLSAIFSYIWVRNGNSNDRPLVRGLAPKSLTRGKSEKAQPLRELLVGGWPQTPTQQKR